MYRLGELTAGQRTRYGAGLLGVGLLAMVLAIVIVHWAHFPTEPSWTARWSPSKSTSSTGCLAVSGGRHSDTSLRSEHHR